MSAEAGGHSQMTADRAYEGKDDRAPIASRECELLRQASVAKVLADTQPISNFPLTSCDGWRTRSQRAGEPPAWRNQIAVFARPTAPGAY